MCIDTYPSGIEAPIMVNGSICVYVFKIRTIVACLCRSNFIYMCICLVVCLLIYIAMDELLQECFLQALKTRLNKTELPLLTSTFYSAHMIPLCPAHLRLDIKKSSYKKVNTRILCMHTYLHHICTYIVTYMYESLHQVK